MSSTFHSNCAIIPLRAKPLNPPIFHHGTSGQPLSTCIPHQPLTPWSIFSFVIYPSTFSEWRRTRLSKTYHRGSLRAPPLWGKSELVQSMPRAGGSQRFGPLRRLCFWSLALHWPLCKFLHALPSYPRAIRTHLCCHCGFVVSFVTICLSHSFFAWVICFFVVRNYVLFQWQWAHQSMQAQSQIFNNLK